jgi:hypothetical protein
MRYFATLVAAALAAAVAVAGPAGAADPAPTFDGCGKAVKDSPSDGTSETGGAPDQSEIEGAFLNADASTINIIIKNLDGTVPPPYSSITYDAKYDTSDGSYFVRAYLDFTGSVVFEYGHLDTTVSTTPRYQRDGSTQGKLFEGQHGVVQIAIPPEAGGKPGTTLKALTAETQLGETTVVPGAVPSPTRGLSAPSDDVGLGSVTLGACASPATPTTSPSTPTGTPPSATQQTAGPLPVTLVSKSVKHAKTVKIKVRSSQPLTKLGARISKGSKVYGTGKLAKLNGNGTFKVKAPKLRKGTYLLAIAGTDAAGNRRTASFKLKVK